MLGSLLALLTGLFVLFGNIYAKEWSMKPRASLFAITLLFYIASSIVFPISLRFGTLTVLNTVASMVTVAATPLIGLALFRERISSVQAIGLTIGILAVVLLAIPFRGGK